MNTQYVNIFHIAIATIVLAFGATACSDDITLPAGSVPEGEDATISLKVAISEPQKLSRATTETYVEDLWVGIYNAKSGACTYNNYFTNNSDPGSHALQTLKDIKCKSGESYIVAVANIAGITGYNMDTHESGTLSDMLSAAQTWDAYRQLAVDQSLSSDGAINVRIPTSEFLMSGSYMANNAHTGRLGAPQTVMINPKVSNLTGAIHLERLWSKNTLNISHDGDIIDMELLNLEVVNVPKYSWITERDQDETGTEIVYANAGDAFDPEGGAIKNANYLTSLRFTTSASEVVTDGDNYKFTFWQYENKREGRTDFCTVYEKREIEYKETDNQNTGIYQSLCESAKGSLNNNATFVRLQARITYKDAPTDTDDNVNIPTKPVSRTALVTYNIHLGYINNVATDFNCYRNTNYTYNVSVTGVHSVLVEAFTGNEPQPGAEGIVTDADQMEYIDAHYGHFNIFLSEDDIKTFSFIMLSYDATGAEKRLYMDKDGTNNIPASGSDDFKYYDWIEIVPMGTGYTTSTNVPNVSAVYPGHQYHGSTDESRRIYYLGDLKTSGLTGQWFTVFVNEYAYENRDVNSTSWGNETGGNWKSYVKARPRQAWFNVDQEISPDGLSIYNKAKFAVVQRSIQTYYDDDATTALGIEHMNETFGMNLRWPGLTEEIQNSLQTDNGRFNVWNSVGDENWTNYYELDNDRPRLQSVNNITNSQATAASISTIAANYRVSMPKLITSGLTTILTTAVSTYTSTAGKNDPQTTNAQYIHVLYACMNRNRDDNGNGVIDEEELKWYVPASGKYVRMILGRNNLEAPLMNYTQATLPTGCGDGDNTLYHYISSDAKIIWADEGMSSSFFRNGNQWSQPGWEVRCIRNLGTNLQTTPTSGETEQVQPAYLTRVNPTTHGGVVKVSHYYGNAVRSYTTQPLPMHKTSARENMLGEYGFEIAPRGNVLSSASSFDYEHVLPQVVNTTAHTVTDFGYYSTYTQYSDSVNNATPCKYLNDNSGRTGWRVPNQKEVVIMMRMKVFGPGLMTWYTSTTQGWNTTYTLHEKESGNIGMVMSCTQEHWTWEDGTENNITYKAGSSAAPLSKLYRITTVQPSQSIGIANWNGINAVRCVRDFQSQAEADAAYNALSD